MNSKNFLMAAGIAALAVLASAASAWAATAYATAPVNVRTGPDSSYAKVGQLHVGQKVDVAQCKGGWCYVQYKGPAGWVSASYLSADAPDNEEYAPPIYQDGNGDVVPPIYDDGSEEYAPPIFQPKPKPIPQPIPVPDSGVNFGFSFGSDGTIQFGVGQQPQQDFLAPVACFYEGSNYSGASICLEEGTTYASLNAWKNRISSIRVYGGATAEICSLKNFYGACQKVTNDRGQLGELLNNRINSIEVY